MENIDIEKMAINHLKIRLDRPQPRPTVMPFRVRTLGRMCDQPYHSTRGTYHGDAMLTVMLAGRGIFVRAGKAQAVGAGMIGLVLPSADTGLLMAEPTEPYDHLYCRFAGEQALVAAKRIMTGRTSPFFVSPRWVDVAQTLMRGLSFGPVVDDRPERPRRVDAVLAEALAQLEEPTPDTGPTLTHAALEQYMRDRLTQPIHLDPMAAHFGVSKPHLCRVARVLLGRTIQHAWEAAKIEWACVLLSRSDLEVGQIGRRVGYDDPFYFSKVFRRAMGASPSAWRVSASGAAARKPLSAKRAK